MMIPKIKNYGQYDSDNYGVHTLQMNLDQMGLWYSYDTVVAYRDNKDGLVVCENVWGPTTGKHLNWIDGADKKSRAKRETFLSMLNAALERNRLTLP